MKLSELYEQDETAWLEESSRLIAAQRYRQLDFRNLVDFLDSMARKDRRQLRSRVRLLLAHLLKWQVQPAKRTASWEKTIAHQRAQLRDLLDSQTLTNHAKEYLPDYYAEAVRDAASETDMDVAVFPKACPFSLDFLLSDEFPQQASED